MRFNIKGKRGFIGSALSDFWGYVVFVFAIIIFFVFFKIQASDVLENRIGGLASENKIDTILLNYLKTPIQADFDGEEKTITISDLIIRHHTNVDFKTGDFQEILKDKTKEIFDKRFENLGWRVIVTDKLFDNPSGLEAISGQTEYKSDVTVVSPIRRLSRSCTVLPNPKPNSVDVIKIDLIFVNLFELNKFKGGGFVREDYLSSKYMSLSC